MGSFHLATTTATRPRQTISRRLYGRTKTTRNLGGNYKTETQSYLLAATMAVPVE